ncbi:GNAT family protein [Streptomyces sp. NPDC005963]|uniref:GNAT family N-acetyltransferase n=1 Tax=Streptomyces sp. NPDC005963 TaxID=3156721 RepID=UPI0033FC3087
MNVDSQGRDQRAQSHISLMERGAPPPQLVGTDDTAVAIVTTSPEGPRPARGGDGTELLVRRPRPAQGSGIGSAAVPCDQQVPADPLEPLTLTAGEFLLRRPSVAEHMEALALGLDPDVRLWTPRCQITDEASAIRDCLAGADWSDGTHATFSIIHGGSGRYAGNIALHSIDRANSQAKVGYRIAPWTRRQGVATAAVRSVVGWAQVGLGLTRLVLTHGLENIASCRVAQKAGFELEGTVPMAKRFGDEQFHDEHLHVLRTGLTASARS